MAKSPPLPVQHLSKEEPGYSVLGSPTFQAAIPSVLHVSGNAALLTSTSVALFCSVKCPGDLILKTYDLARALRDAGITVIGGFHSPMEKECLTLLLRGDQPVIVCLARGLENLRLPATWKPALAAGRLLLVSPFDNGCRRVTEETAEKRNRCIVAIAESIIVTYAHAGGRLEQLCRDAVTAGKTFWTLDDAATTNLVQQGARPISADALPRSWISLTTTNRHQSARHRSCWLGCE
ncbi:MAG: DNA-processing protein DprA [Phycisphaerae bacterium]|nr:DNA-processing protein DprA [Phycisphaerae bacterium]